MPVSFPFKQGIPRDACCLFFDRDVQNLTGDILVFDAFSAHGKVGMALAFLFGESRVMEMRRTTTHHHSQERNAQWQSSIVSSAETLFRASSL